LPTWPEESPRARLARLGAWLAERKLAWTAVRLTDPLARAVGLEVAKVVMPNLLRLTVSREATDLGSPRLHLPLVDAGTETPNPEPHPVY
jgi:hypothetical protein